LTLVETICNQWLSGFAQTLVWHSIG